MARWGLIPHWLAEMPKRRPINARAESFVARPFFRHMLNRRHCHHTGQWLLRMEACQGASQGAVVHPSER
ncbi:MAG: SOS response-associated peptidase family protein [Chlorobaculum sp.]